jgi:Holliday junction resolvase-like predicted endonuclease
MRIEIADVAGVPSKAKGDLFEAFAADLLRTQNYEVETQVRVTASELDLLCIHRVNQKRLYVECKARRDPLSANVLTNLLGVLT